jgi:hypothetical protein
MEIIAQIPLIGFLLLSYDINWDWLGGFGNRGNRRGSQPAKK